MNLFKKKKKKEIRNNGSHQFIYPFVHTKPFVKSQCMQGIRENELSKTRERVFIQYVLQEHTRQSCLHVNRYFCFPEWFCLDPGHLSLAISSFFSLQLFCLCNSHIWKTRAEVHPPTSWRLYRLL